MNSLALMQQVLLEAPALAIDGLNPERSLEDRAQMVTVAALTDFEALLNGQAVAEAPIGIRLAAEIAKGLKQT